MCVLKADLSNLIMVSMPSRHPTFEHLDVYLFLVDVHESPLPSPHQGPLLRQLRAGTGGLHVLTNGIKELIWRQGLLLYR
jgi:hypothetical protein